MCEDATELGRVAFQLDQGAAKLSLFLSLGQRLLEQAAEAILLSLDSQEILNLLPCTRTWDLRAKKHPANDLSVREAGRFDKGAETGDVLLAYACPDEMPKTPQPIDSKPRSTLVERESRAVRANKPKALSTLIKCGREDRRRRGTDYPQFC